MSENKTLFVVLPQDEIVTLRDLPGSLPVFVIKAQLELLAGLCNTTYTLHLPGT